MPGGGIPIGAPLPGGIPIGGPIGGRMPGGGILRLPGGGAPRPIGGGAPRPGGYWVGAPAMLAPAAAAATVPLPCGVITCPPTPLTGPATTPANGTRAIPTRFSPRSRTRPRTLFSSRSGCLDCETYLIFLNSSQSHRMRFMCLSKALKVPMKIRPSCRMHLILKSICCSILLLLPTVWNQPIRDRHYDISTNTGPESIRRTL
uniref:Uncharacterized protein n=1 Tax=Sander lucioperca TaxID=283035 RepID=A0A8D0AGE3_SANLU